MKTYTWMDFFGGLRGTIFAGISVLLLGGFGIQTLRLSWSQTEAAEAGLKLSDANNQITLLEETAKSNLADMEKLSKDNADLLEERRVNLENNAKALDALALQIERLDAQLETGRKVRRDMIAGDSYAATRATSPVPLPLYQRMLELSVQPSRQDGTD